MPQSGVRSVSRTERDEIVVVGCGVAGLTAALAASEAGADVTVLEKAPKEHRGGHTRFTESFRLPTADIESDAEFNVEDYSAADFYSDIMLVTKGAADPDLAKTVTDNAAAMFEWLTDHGIEWEYQAPHSGYTAGRVWLDGEEFVTELVALVEAAGGDIHYNAEVRSIDRDEHGAADGVTATVDGERVRYVADAVILAAGDYGSSKEKRTRYYGPGYGQMTVRGSRYNTGEAIDAALDAGAKSDGEWGHAHMAIIDAGSPPVEGGITRIDGYQYGVMLNHDGERFVDEGEDARAHTYAKFGQRIFEQPYHEAFIIVDSKVVDDVAHMGPSRPVTGDTIEELLRRLDVDNVERGVETIQAYNAACDPGEYDPDRLDGNATEGVTPSKSNWALPIDEPPYTGYPVTGGMTFGFGGVAITTEAQVLDTTDEVIDDLYAAGNATGGLFYHNYPGGTGLTNAAVFGRLAGENAASNVLSQSNG